MARFVNKKDVFYRFDSDDAYQTREGTIARMSRSNIKYLGDKVNEHKDVDIEDIRVKRAVTLLEKSGGQLLRKTKVKGSGKRLSGLFREVLKFDEEHYYPGLRSVHNGMQTMEGRTLLKGFDFNPYSDPGKVLGDVYTLDLKKGVLCLHDFSPGLLLSKTTQVSQLRIRFLLSRVDFLLGEFITFMSKEQVLTAEDPKQNLRLKVGKRPQTDGLDIAFLWIGFERDDAVAVPELLRRVDDVFRVVCVPYFDSAQ